jgi:hypothetical protein
LTGEPAYISDEIVVQSKRHPAAIRGGSHRDAPKEGAATEIVVAADARGPVDQRVDARFDGEERDELARIRRLIATIGVENLQGGAVDTHAGEAGAIKHEEVAEGGAGSFCEGAHHVVRVEAVVETGGVVPTLIDGIQGDLC